LRPVGSCRYESEIELALGGRSRSRRLGLTGGGILRVRRDGCARKKLSGPRVGSLARREGSSQRDLSLTLDSCESLSVP
jgi:hypothetical protein